MKSVVRQVIAAGVVIGACFCVPAAVEAGVGYYYAAPSYYYAPPVYGGFYGSSYYGGPSYSYGFNTGRRYRSYVPRYYSGSWFNPYAHGYSSYRYSSYGYRPSFYGSAYGGYAPYGYGYSSYGFGASPYGFGFGFSW